MTAQKKERLQYVDTAKFIAIFIVIFCHSISKGYFRHVGYSFHLPIFFILNGITLKIPENQSFGEYLERKLKSYLIPIFCLGIILAFVELGLSFSTNSPLTIRHVGTMLIQLLEQKRVYPIWFVGALLFADIFFYFVVKAGKNKLLPCALFSSLFLGLAIFFNIYYRYRFVWNIDVALFGVFFVFIGYAFSHDKLTKIREFLLQKRWISLLFGIGLFLVGQAFGEYNYRVYQLHLEMWAMQYGQYHLTIPCAVLSSLGVILFSNAITNRFLGELGKTTLVLLAFHQILTLPLFYGCTHTWYAQIAPLGGDDWRYLLYHLTATLVSVITLAGVHYLIIYSPFAFIINKKIPNFYKEKWEWFKGKLIKK